MEHKNLISIIAKLANNKTLSTDERRINERALIKAKQNGYNVTGQYNFEVREIGYLPPLKEETKGVLTKTNDIESLLNRCVFIPNCQNAMKVPFVSLNNIDWGVISGDNCTFDSAKMSAKRLSTVCDISLEVLNSTNEDFQINFQNAVFENLYKKVFESAFSQQRGGEDKPTGLFYNLSSSTISSVEDLINLQKDVDKLCDGGIWVCSPTAKAKLNEINTTTNIFDNGKMLNSDIIFTSLVEDGFICYLDLSKFVICEFGVMGVTIDNFTKKIDGKVRLTFEGYFDFDLADKNCIKVGQFQ